MSPSRATRVGLFARSLLEALEGVAGRERAGLILTRALSRAAMPTVPEELEAFRRFTEGPLREAVERQLQPTEVDTIFELVAHVLWMATSDVQSRRAEKDEQSGERSVEGMPFRTPQLPPTPVPPSSVPPKPPIAPPVARAELETRAMPSADPTRSDARVRERKPSMPIARVRRPSDPNGGVVEIGPTASSYESAPRVRVAPLDVLVLTLDPLLVFETENGLAGRGRVTTIQTAAELARAASAAKGKLVVLVDSALPSIDLPTFAPISGSLPPGTRIVLWGVDERQKQRLAAMFPPAKDWIPSGRAASPAELILDL